MSNEPQPVLYLAQFAIASRFMTGYFAVWAHSEAEAKKAASELVAEVNHDAVHLTGAPVPA